MRAVGFFPLQAHCGAQPLTSARATMAVQAASHPLQLLIHHQNCQRNCFDWLNFSSSGFQKHLLFCWNSENVLFWQISTWGLLFICLMPSLCLGWVAPVTFGGCTAPGSPKSRERATGLGAVGCSAVVTQSAQRWQGNWNWTGLN